MSTISLAPPRRPSYRISFRDVPRVGLGLGPVARTAVEEGTGAATGVLHEAFDLGVRLFDAADLTPEATAPDGAAPLLAESFAGHRDDVVYTATVGGDPAPSALRAAVLRGLAALATDYLDVVLLRRDGATDVALADQLDELVRMRDEGLVVGIGLSHLSEDEVREAMPVGPCAVRNEYNLLARGDEATLDLTRRHGLAWVPRCPLGTDDPRTGHPQVADDAVVQQVAADLGATPEQVGLAWLLTHSPNAFVVRGAATTEGVRATVAARDLVLDDDVMTRLETPHV